MKKVENGMSNDKDIKSELGRTWRNYLIFPVVFGVYYSIVLTGYVQSEWTQSMLRKQYFANKTDNFSSCENTNTSDPLYKKYQKVQQSAAQWGMIFSLALYIPAIFTQILLPSYTDYFGRKYLLILATIAIAIRNTSVTLTVYFEASFWYIAAGTIVMGLGGAGMGFGAASFAYTADITCTKTERTVGDVVTEAMIKFAVVVSSYTSGLFIETLELGFFYTALISTCFTFLMLILIIILKESLPKSNRSKPKPLLTTLKSMTEFYFSDSYKGKRKAYILLVITFGVATIITINRGHMETLYFLGRPFCWGPSKIGIFSMTFQAANTICGLASIWVLPKYLSNATIGIIGSLSSAVSYTVEGLATTTLMIYMVPVTGIFTFLIIPMIRSLMSALTPLDRQGAMFAGAATIQVICALIANLSQSAIYSLSLAFMNGFVFIVCAVCSVVIMALMYLIKRTGQETYLTDMNNPETSEEQSYLKVPLKTENQFNTGNEENVETLT